MIPIWGIVGGVGLVLGMAVGVQSYRLNSCKGNMAELRASYSILAGEVEEQNRAVDDLREKSKIARDAAKRAEEKFRKSKENVKVVIERIPEVKVDGTCEDEIKTINTIFAAARGMR